MAKPGDVLEGRYRLERELGAGASGVVFEAVHVHTLGRVAVKVLRTGAVMDAAAIERFKREAQMLARLDHPALVRVHDFGFDAASRSVYVVQELLVGDALRARMEPPAPLPPADVLRWAVPLAEALEAAHAGGVVHRDVKPENVFLTRQGAVKLLDFGIADDGAGARGRAVVGTLAYMAPEQARGDADLDPRVDVWSLGVVLYEALTGRLPYASATLPQLVYAHVATQPPRALDLAPTLPDGLARAVDRALRVERADRFATMSDMLAALRAARDGQRVTTAPAAPSRPRVLLVDDDPDLRRTLVRALRDYDVRDAADGALALEALAAPGRFDLVITDLNMPRVSGMDVVRAAVAQGVPAIMISVQATLETAVQAMRLGAVNFIPKPFSSEALQRAITDVLAARRLAQPVDDVVVQDEGFLGVTDMAAEVARSGATVLLTGETGTGKDVVARMIHRLGPRASKPFVMVDVRALDPDTAERELFGWRRGAFPGADEDYAGLVGEAEGATLFLDEVGELPASVQAKVGRLVAERTYAVVGDPRPKRCSVHVVAASQDDLNARVAAGRFRQDLYYRLAVVTLRLPPLRERRDLEALVARFVVTASHAARKPVEGVDDAAMAALRAYPWPGNVRELHNAITQAVMRAHGPRVTRDDLPAAVRGASPSVAPTAGPRPEFAADLVMGLLQGARDPGALAALLGGDREALVTWLGRADRGRGGPT